jgi:membrane protease subunit HflK
MAFNDKSGGPWGSGSGPNNGGSGGNNPWGGGNNQNNNPDLDDILKTIRDRFKKFYPSGPNGNRFLLLIVFIIFVIWLLSGFYSVGTQQQGVVLRFGDYLRTTQPGLHYHLPSPIEQVLLPQVTSVNRIDIGFRALDGNSNARRDVSSESKMITGDENIVDIDFRVMWKISMAENFLFNLQDPEETIKVAAESVMRGIIGQTKIESALTDAKESIQSEARTKLQELVDDYGAGIEIRDVQLLSVNPPSEDVIDAFNDVQRARQEKVSL